MNIPHPLKINGFAVLSSACFALSGISAFAADIIVDNADATGVTLTGTWTVTTNPGYYGTTHIHDGAAGKGSKSVRFSPNLTTAGNYQVYAWWVAGANRATNVPVDIISTSGTASMTVNEQVNGSIWNYLGTYFFASGTTGSLLIKNDSTAANTYVFADAVRFVPADGSPFGISMSSSSRSSFSAWASTVAATGVKWVRGTHGINTVEPTQGNFSWSAQDGLINSGTSLGLQWIGLISYNASWINSNVQTFPTDNLPAWGNYVFNLVNHCKDRVKYWEVGNEPPNYTSNGTAQQYADTMSTAYTYAKQADPNCLVGLAGKSADINWLYRTLNAGAVDKFDFITLHPYEVLDSVSYGFEGTFLSIVSKVRKMLADVNPAKVNVPIIFTEIGDPVGHVNGSITTTADMQAQELVKVYAMSLAQGVAQIDWFEGRDGDSGAFGLLTGSNVQRPAYAAMSNLIQRLGAVPQYLGWVLLNSKEYAFVFQGASTTVMVTWARPGTTDTISFGQTVQIVDPLSGGVVNVSSYSLTESPVLVVGVPASLVTQAQANKSLPFPWGGDFTNAASVGITMPDTDSGLHQLKKNVTSTSVTSPYGSARYCDLVVSGTQKGGSQFFTVDPNYLSYTKTPITITAVVRRNAANDPATIRVYYESLTGESFTPAYSIPGNTQWYTQTWTINDAQFVGNFGFNFRITSASPKYYIQSVTVAKVDANFNASPVSSYGGQDSASGTATTLDDGMTLKLVGNLWKKISYPYNVTPNTVLEFDFKAPVQGEIHGIGVDTDNVEGGANSIIFQLYGTQSYGNQSYHTYSGSNWVHYTIPLGAYLTGFKAYLVFANDKDASPYTNESYFRNVILHE